MNLQTRYDLEIEKDRLGAVLDEIHLLRGSSRPAGTVPTVAHAPAGYAPWPPSDEDRATR